MKPFEPAPPAKGMKVRLKHNEFRDLVNELRDTADRYGGTDQLRDQLAHTLARRVRPVPEIVEMRPEREQTIDKLRRFAALVAAAERDASACRPHSELHDILSANALAIRARGDA